MSHVDPHPGNFAGGLALYIRRIKSSNGYYYVLRESYREGELWKHRDLMDLGWSPADYLASAGDGSIYLRLELEEALAAKGAIYSAEELVEAFLPYMNHSSQRSFERSQSQRMRVRSPPRTCPVNDFWKYERNLHAFDKRRLYYLRFGHIAEIDHMDGRTLKFTKALLCKSRDEIENVIEGMEHQLRSEEIGPYLYVAFGLQSHFRHHILRSHPEALSQEALDRHFLEEICKLGSDPFYFQGVERADNGRLHFYVVKYVTMYFDRGFKTRAYRDDYIRDFMNRHRSYRRPFPPAGATMAVQEACTVLGITEERLRKMGNDELTRLYRRKAKRLHPDTGGSHEAFVKLTEAYEVLLARR